MEKYISYCLYGKNPKYIVGAEKNIKINNDLLPDWKTIIYYDSSDLHLTNVDNLKRLGGVMIDIKSLDISKNVSYQMFWRYFIFEKNNISIVRDLDSRITKREVSYIDKWLNSENNYFVIRDHPWQSEIPGGLFGIKSPSNFWRFFVNFVKTNNLGWGVDQKMLEQYMNNVDMKKVSYFSFDKKEDYIPRDDKNFFIGIQLDENENVVSPNSTLALDYLKHLNI